MSDSGKKRVLMVAGEPSGDRAAARVAKNIMNRESCHIFGVGGERMRSAGVDLLAHIDKLTALGFTESAKRFGHWARAWVSIRKEVERKKPDVALLVDTPEINLPLARILSEKGTRVVWYVGPQVWAWRKGRLGLLRNRADVVALILPFEKQLYDSSKVKSVFVGHPIMDEPAPKPKNEIRKALGAAPNDKLLAFLPGSRPAEISRHSQEMISAAKRLRQRGIKTVFAPPRNAASESMLRAAQTLAMASLPDDCSARDVLAACDAAIVASGTATLEAAVLGVPMAVVYVLDGLSWALGKKLLHIPYVSLPNWVAGREIVPELLQGDFSADSLVEMADALLGDDEKKRQIRELEAVSIKLGEPGVGQRVARLVLERLG